MSELDSRLKDISEIRTLMEKSSKFLSLSGLSGISAGVIALIGAFAANQYLSSKGVTIDQASQDKSLLGFLLLIAGVVLVIGLGCAIFFSTQMAKKKGYPIWNNTTKWMVASLFVPMGAGGIFCLILVYNGLLHFAIPATMLFYGLSLLNASKYTVTEIRYLALSEIALGLIASIWFTYGLIFWAIGFGVLHILYGVLLYQKYEK